MASRSSRTYSSVNQTVLRMVPDSSTTILDVGCGGGELGLALKHRNPTARVTGVTWSAEEATRAESRLDDVFVRDLDTQTIADLGIFDCIICSHVLEHLRSPRGLLIQLTEALTPEGFLVVALPNVLHWRQRLAFVRGEFRYTQGGIMDDTHLVFFDWNTARDLIEGSGFEVLDASSDGSFPGSRFFRGPGRMLNKLALRIAPGLFGWQFVFLARRGGVTR